MRLPLHISFQGLEHSDAIEAAVRKHAKKLDHFCPDIMRCRVSVILAEKHKHQGKPFAVRIDATIPGRELVSNREHDEDVYVALRDAFDDMGRMLEDAVRRRRGQVKVHPTRLHGSIVRLNPDERYGFIRASDGTEYYFGRDNVIDAAFDDLALGTPVHFIAEMAAEGPQAKRVTLARHHAGEGEATEADGV
ncbi:MAG TPA: HPF/RaiA family ribosome-associated protein [Casimicrobiaceae bacterium]